MLRLRERLLGFTAASAMMHVVGLRALALGVNLGTGLVTAAVLGPAGRGEQAALVVAPQFLSAIATLGLHASLIYNMKAEPSDQGRFLGCSMIMALMAGLVATVAGWMLMPFWLHQHEPHIVHVARWLILITPLSVLTPLLTGTLEAHGRFGVANRTLYLQSLTTLAALALLWAGAWLTPTTAAIAYLGPSIPTFAYFGRLVFRMVPPEFTLRPSVRRPLLRFGLRFYGVDLLGTIAAYLDQIIVLALLQQSVVGVYVVALSLSRMLTVLQGAVTSVLFPSIAARTAESVIDTVAMTVRITTVINIAAACCLALVGPYALHLLYGHRFMGAVTPFRILLLETVISNAARILYQTFSATGRPGTVTAIESAAVLTSLLAMLAIVPSYGIDGAACCVLLASSLRLASVLVCLPMVLKVGIPRLILTPADVMGIVGR